MKNLKRTAAFAFASGLLATAAFSGAAAASTDCGSAQAKVVWSPMSSGSIVSFETGGGTTVGNPKRGADFYCTRVRTQDGVMVVGAVWVSDF